MRAEPGLQRGSQLQEGFAVRGSASQSCLFAGASQALHVQDCYTRVDYQYKYIGAFKSSCLALLNSRAGKERIALQSYKLTRSEEERRLSPHR